MRFPLKTLFAATLVLSAAYRSQAFLEVTEKSFAGFVKTADQQKLTASK